MLWYKILQNTIYCGKLAFTTYWVYEPDLSLLTPSSYPAVKRKEVN